ncbi:Esterase/lipase [Rubrivivax sp. A210]|nr:Esterase/lipase [Rubrivivax sp. A210]
MNRHLHIEDRISDLLQHPDLAGFARLLLPGGSVAVDPDMRLREVGSLMPYHSRVHPPEVVAALNRLIDDTRSGHVVFHDNYTAAEKHRDPSLEATGLFFLRGRPGAPFALVAPGGGFSYVATLHEGLPYALQINRRGYNAFVLVYRVGQGGAPATRDLAVALSHVVRHAAELAVSSRDWSLWGSSAGARMVAAIGTHGTHGTAAYGGDELPRPAAVVMAYTGHSEIARQGETDPPTFVIAGEQDRIAPEDVMERRVAALRRAGARVEYRRYAGVGHGFGAGTGTSAEGWIDDAIRFWEGVMPHAGK